MTAKYGIPYFANFLNSDLSPDDVHRHVLSGFTMMPGNCPEKEGPFGANPLHRICGSRYHPPAPDRLFEVKPRGSSCRD